MKNISIGILNLAFLHPIVGAAQYARNVVKNIKKYPISIYSFENEGISELKNCKNLEFFLVKKPPKNLVAIKILAQLFEKMKKNHNVLILAAGIEVIIGILYKYLKNPKVKLIVQFHHISNLNFFELLKEHKFFGIFEYLSFLLMKKCDAIITPSETWQKILKVKLNYKKNMCIAYNSVEPVKKGNLKIKLSKPIIYTGLCQPKHNIELIIKALPLIKEKFPGVTLLLTGRRNEKYYKKLIDLAKYLKVEKNIKYLGILKENDLRNVYEASDVVVFVPKEPYGWSIVLLKGILYKKPCIALNIGSLPELIKRYDGIIINESPLELARAVENILSNKTYARKIVTNAYKRLRKDTWKAAANIHIKCIEKLMKKPFRL
ncbi:MAG: glycosyltransferase family 4 protein [Candidatus Aenigmatarchaeota archaeon]